MVACSDGAALAECWVPRSPRLLSRTTARLVFEEMLWHENSHEDLTVKLAKVDIDQNTDLAGEHQVM